MENNFKLHLLLGLFCGLLVGMNLLEGGQEKIGGKWLWLRNNASTIISQFIDTNVFMFIAFYNLTPKFTAAFVFSLVIPYYLFKVLFALLDTPFVYLGVKWLKDN
ncbi:MAG: queuosine precursor transporter [Patescibacteria group bacterium]|jgi:hypothetical protein